MPDITLEKLHSLLEQLAEHMLTRMASKADLAQFAAKADLAQIATKADIKVINTELNTLKANVAQILDGQNAQAKRLDEMFTELIAISKTLDVYNERKANLEIHNFGYRVRDKES